MMLTNKVENVSSAIILAGGLGTRLRSAVPDLPKSMAPINGRPFLERQLDYWIDQGVRHFVLSVGYRRKVIQDHFGAVYREASINYAIEDQPLGTGGSLLLAVNMLPHENPFLLLNGDTFFEVELTKLTEFHISKQSEWTFSLFRTKETKRYMGIEVNQNNRIVSFNLRTEKRENLANGGVYLVDQQILSKIPNGVKGVKISLENEIIPAMLKQSCRFFGYPSKGLFIDIGIPRDYFMAGEMLPE